jgi:hypothetical protein
MDNRRCPHSSGWPFSKIDANSIISVAASLTKIHDEKLYIFITLYSNERFLL